MENGFSPGEILLMGQKIYTNVSFLPKLLYPKHPSKFQPCKKGKDIRIKQKQNFNSHHRAKDLQPLERKNV